MRRVLRTAALLAGFAITAAAIVGWFERPRDVGGVLVWFTAAIAVHDLGLVPAYSLAHRLAFGRLHGRLHPRASRSRHARSPKRLANPAPYLQVPALLSCLIGAVFLPVIAGLGARAELDASGIPERGYLLRWLLLSAALFTLSGAAYLLGRDGLRSASGREVAAELGQPVVEILPRTKAEHLARAPSGRVHVPHVAEAKLAGHAWLGSLCTRRARQCPRHLQHGPGGPAGDVERASLGIGAGERDHARPRDVTHMDEVAQLLAVLEHLRWTARRDLRGKDRRDARVGRVPGHPRAVDVVVPQRGDRYPGLS